MSDHDSAPDPMDEAYAKAETALSDAAARSARRVRVLAAVARESATPAVSSPSVRPWFWRQGGWLVAASVAGLSVLVAIHLYSPVSLPYPASPEPPAPLPKIAAASPAAPPKTPALRPLPAAPRAPPPIPPPSPPDIAPITPPPLPILPRPQHSEPPPPASVTSAPPPPAPAAPAFAVVGEQNGPADGTRDAAALPDFARDRSVEAQRFASSNAERAPMSAFAAPSYLAPLSRSQASNPITSDGASRLRAAAGAGRIDQLKTLLGQGFPVDAPDADGETALMKSVQADHPDAAALLRRQGASLDLENRAGESARDMAGLKHDAELNRALGLDP